MAKIIMAVGKSLGPYFDPDQPDKDDPEYFEISAGPWLGEFTVDQALVWDIAHHELDLQTAFKFDRAALEKAVRDKTRIDEPSPLVDFLLSEGVLVEADLEDEHLEPFFRKYRLIPTAFSAGNLKDRRNIFTLSMGDNILVPLSLAARSVWSRSYLEGDIWSGCETIAKGWRKHGHDVDALYFASEIAEFLPMIVAQLTGVLEPIE